MRKILISLAIFMAFIQQIITVCTAPKPYLYNGVCYGQCPWNPPDVTYLNTDNTCVTACAGPTLFADDSTKSCVTTCPSSPIKTYYDHNLQKCVQMCPSNPSHFALQSNRSCLAQCPSPYYADDATRVCVDSCPTQKYYQIVGTLRICTSKCYPSYYGNQSKVCVTALNCPSSPVKYYGDDLSGLCVKSCPQNASTYAQESTRLCVHDCTVGTYADPTTLKCVPKCPTLPTYYGSNTTKKCHLMCIEGEFGYSVDQQCYQVCPSGYGDYKSRMCVQTCPQGNQTFADPLTKLCIAKCSPGYFADNDTRMCKSAVDCTGNLVGNPLTLQCINGQNCPAGYFIDYTIFMCVKRCTSGQFANLDTRVCSTSCPWDPPLNITFKDSQSRKCVNQCPFNPRTFSDNVTQSCLSVCGAGTYGTTLNFDCVQTCPDGFFGDSLTRLCVSKCTTNTTDILYFYSTNISCIATCPLPTYADNTTLTCVKVCPNNMFAQTTPDRFCVQKCQNTFYGDNFTKTCVQKCPAISKQYADDSTNLCVKICPLDPDYFGQDLNDGNRKCVSNCTLSDVFADPVTRTCQKECNTTLGYFGDIPSRRCVLKCPTGYGNFATKQCTDTCPQSPIQFFGDNLTSTCVQRCPNNTYGNRILDVCVKASDCPTGTYGDDSTNMCVSKCPFLLNTFGDPITRKCVLSCQYNHFADPTTRLCSTSCNATAQLYKDPSTRRCVLICPSMPDLYNDPSTMTCVASCNSASYPYRYAYQTIRKCVSMCPASPVYFADEQAKKCVTRCANGTYRFVNNTYRGCLSYCPLQIFNATVNLTLYQDNTTWTCVSVCPLGYYAFKHPSNDTIRKCVRMCEIVAGVYYFADDLTRSCVTACPMRTQKTYGDRIAFKCVKTCTRKQYRDQTTKQCTYQCPKTPTPFYADNSTWNCSRKCPEGTYAEDINNTCAKQCPTNYFGYKQKCLTSCPTNTTVFVYQDNTTWFCIPTCTTLPDYYSDPQNQKCVKNCTVGSFADNYTRTCLSALKCSNNTAADPLTYRCVAQCSKVPMYFLTLSTNLCGPTCANGLFAYNQTNLCVENCPAPYFGVNTVPNFYCIQYCPTGQFKFINVTSGFRICRTVCPTNYFGYQPTMECMTSCPVGYFGNTSNLLCVLDCTPLYAQDSTKMCVSVCQNGTTADNNTYRCIQQCVYGQFMENKTCVPSCSSGLFADNLTRQCKTQCPADPFTFADSFTKKCLFQCSPSYYGHFGNRTCLQSCPDGFFKELTLRICINPCLEGQFADPQTQSCVVSCAASIYLYSDYSTQSCVMKCPSSPDLYGLANKCIEHCPLGKFAQNFTRTCVDICPNVSNFYLNESFADDLTRRCLQKCSALSFSFKNITHNVCLNVCPNGFFASELLQACVQVCPNTTFARNNSKQCVSHCPDLSFGDTYTQTCMDGCYYNNQFADSSTNMCVDICPSQPDLYGQTSTKTCVLKCTPGLFTHPDLRLCVPNCATPYYADPDSGLCVLTCPTHALQFADQHLRRCVSSCSNYSGVIQYADKTTKKCVTQCPSSPQVLYGLNETNTCQPKCPLGTFGDNETRLCLDFCIFELPKFNWMDTVNRMCVTKCPDGYFSDNTTKYCEQTCSTGTFADNSTNQCVFTCPLTPLSFATTNANGNRVCVYNCSTGTFAQTLTRICVNKCPTQPFYNFHAFEKNACVKECLYPYFGELATQNCVLNCKEGFYGNLTSKKCQACRTQCVTCSAYLQCLTCQVGFFLFQFQCVTACPTYPILYFSLESSAKCFKVCPEPYFGLEATKKCQLSCPVSYYPNLSTRRCTVCPTGCLTCDSAGCLTCYTGFTFVVETKKCNQFCNLTHIYYFLDGCYKQCPDGSFLTRDLVHCDPCNKQCATCDIAAGNCTKCAQKFFYQGLCVDKCPTDYFVNEDMACISCTVIPQRCALVPLTYSIKPFVQNYQSKAYVVFSRTVDMTLTEFVAFVQIYRNGVAVKPSEFTAAIFNSTTYVITFIQSANQMPLNIGAPEFVDPVKQTQSSSQKHEKIQQIPLAYQVQFFTQGNSSKAYIIFTTSISKLATDQVLNLVEIVKQDKKIPQNQLIIKRYNSTTFQLTILEDTKPLVSLNEDTYSIGFKPGTVKDMYGNFLTVNKLQAKTKQKSVVTSSVVSITKDISSSVQAVTVLFIVFVLLYFLKGGYPALLSIQVPQIIFMHIFLYAKPMPLIQLKFLEAMKYFQFLFFPQFKGSDVHDQQYDMFMGDVSFIANSSPLIFVWIIIGCVYGLFSLMSNKKIVQNKQIRRFAKKVKKYRTRYQIIHDGFWLTFIYAMFFAMYQFKSISLDTQTKMGSFFFGAIVLVLYFLFTLFMIKLANQYKNSKKQQIPKKFSFIMPQPHAFPMQLPFRYIRKIFLCFALVMPSFQAQSIIMLMTNSVFLCYYFCYMPSTSKITNYFNLCIEIGYIVIESLFYAYFKLDYKGTQQQYGFSVALIVVQVLMLTLTFTWLLYRLAKAIRQSDVWKYIYTKLTQNTDPDYLKQQQRKRDLQFDFGSLQNRSQFNQKDDFNFSSKNLNLKTNGNNSTKIFFNKQLDQLEQPSKKKRNSNKKQKKQQKKQKVKKYAPSSQQSNSQELSITVSKSIQQKQLKKAVKKPEQKQQLSSKNNSLEISKQKMGRIKTPLTNKRTSLLKIDKQSQKESVQQQVVIKKSDIEEVQNNHKNVVKGIWDDFEFDQNEI